MAYKAAIPQPTDKKSVSQVDMLANFTALNTTFGIDHVTFDAVSDNGKHDQVTFTDSAGALGATGGNQLLLYNNAATLRLNDSANNNFKVFDGTRNVTGYSRLSKGIVMAWGSASNPATGDVTVTPSQITFGTIYAVQITTWMQGTTPKDVLARLKVINVGNSFVVFTSNLAGTAADSGFYWTAIGVE